VQIETVRGKAEDCKTLPRANKPALVYTDQHTCAIPIWHDAYIGKRKSLMLNHFSDVVTPDGISSAIDIDR
jgi:hypothetical protein